MADNILDEAASASQGMLPGQIQNRQQQLTAFGPTPMAQPPAIPRFQAPQINQPSPGGSYNSVGERKRAEKKALFDGIAGFVKAGSDYIAANKQRALSMDIERLMGAQQGMTEAKQILQQDPNNTEAKAALEKNTGIVNMITADPKKAKLLQKAFNIDLFGDGKNKKENQALMTAWTDFQKKQQAGDKTALNPTAQRMMAQQPQRLGLDPQAQAQAEAIKAGLIPKAGELLKTNTEMYKTITTAKTAADRTQAIDQAAKIRADAEKYHADKVMDAANARALGAERAAEIRARAQTYTAKSIAATWDKRIDMLRTIATDKNLNDRDKTILGSMTKDADTYVKQIKTYIDENVKLQAELDKKGTSIGPLVIHAANDADSKLMRQKIGFNNMAVKMMQHNLDELQGKISTMQQMGIITMSGGGSDKTGNSEGGGGDINVNDDEVPE